MLGFHPNPRLWQENNDHFKLTLFKIDNVLLGSSNNLIPIQLTFLQTDSIFTKNKWLFNLDKCETVQHEWFIFPGEFQATEELAIKVLDVCSSEVLRSTGFAGLFEQLGVPSLCQGFGKPLRRRAPSSRRMSLCHRVLDKPQLREGLCLGSKVTGVSVRWSRDDGMCQMKRSSETMFVGAGKSSDVRIVVTRGREWFFFQKGVPGGEFGPRAQGVSGEWILGPKNWPILIKIKK